MFLQTTFFLDNVSWFKVRHIFPHVQVLNWFTTGQLYSLHGPPHVCYHRLEEQPRVPQSRQAHLFLPARISSYCRASSQVNRKIEIAIMEIYLDGE